jgi:alkylation response protein AidB-like acyl-CoA dehydrogenase
MKMSFTYTENQQMITDMVRELASREIKPYMMEWDENQTLPVALFKKMGELGLMGVLVPEAYGGSDFGYPEYVTAIKELGKVDGSVALSMAAHNSLCTGHILQFGSEDQKNRYLPGLATCEYLGAWGLSEPNTGSDAGAMETTATWDGNEWVLQGAKNWTTHGKSGDVIVVMARTGEKNEASNATAFIVDKGTPGFQPGRKENKLGMRASETTEMIFDDCRIPDANRLGPVGDGFHQAMKILDGGRISIAALSLGIGQGAYEAAKQYAQERTQFGRPIAKFQAIGFKLADMATELEASELLTMQAANQKDRGEQTTRISSMAKYYASETAVQIASEAVQIFGGYGFTKDYPVEKHYRDVKLCTIGEGTTEIQKLVISRQLIQ